MPVQIGAKAHQFTDPTGLLSDCHRRIEMFLGSIAAVAEVIDRPATEDIREALEAALRYFQQAAPKHTADEEESLFPRLRGIANADLASALSKLDALEEEHRWANPLHDRLDQLGAKFLSDGRLSLAEIESFRAAIRDLRAMYARHISMEDTVVFPLAARVLSEEQKAIIADEMAGRRKVKVVAIGDAPHGL
jgi:hemerythrin-like domain-containing protein